MTFTDPTLQVSGFDAQGVDSKLRLIGGIEDGWGLPKLPDEVKFDLATQHEASHGSIGSFLWGLAHDINHAVNPLAAEPAAAQTVSDPQPTDTLPAMAPYTPPGAAQRILAGLTNNAAPKTLDLNAISAFKTRAIGSGLLSADTPIDNSWDPAFNTIWYQQQNADFRSRVAGQRPGAVSVGHAAQVVGEFVDPKQLLGATLGAAAKSFYFSGKDLHTAGEGIGEIGHRLGSEVHNWMDWVRHPTSGKKLLNALASNMHVVGAVGTALHKSLPVIMPIVNDALLLTGVGEVIGVARATLAAGEGVEGAYTAIRAASAAENAAEGASLFNRFASVEKGAAFAEKASEPGLIASRLSRYADPMLTGRMLGESTPIAGQVGEAMTEWRNLKSVITAKKALQVGMRAGFWTTVGSKLSPQDSDFNHSIEEWKKKTEDGWLGKTIDLGTMTGALTPPYINSPGTYSRAVSPFTSGLKKAFTIDGVQSHATRAAVEVALALAKKDPEFAKQVQEIGPTAALVAKHGGSEEAANAFTTWAAYLTAIDAHARAKAGAAADDLSQPAAYKKAWLQLRNASIAKLMHVDEGDTDGFLQLLAAKGNNKAYLEWQKRLNVGTDLRTADQWKDDMNVLIRDHMEKRAAFARDLRTSVQPGAVQQHMERFFQNNDNWENFLAATNDLKTYVSAPGVLDQGGTFIDPETGKKVYNGLRYDQAFSPNNRAVGGLHGEGTVSRILMEAALENPDITRAGWAMPLARDISPSQGRFTLMRADGVDKQHAVEMLSAVSTAQRRASLLARLERDPALQDLLARGFRGEQNLPGLTDSQRETANLLKRLSKSGDFDLAAIAATKEDFSLGVSQARSRAQQAVRDFEAHPAWAERFNIPSWFTLDQKTKELKDLSSMLAARVTGLPPEVEERISNYGYKVVHGSEYIMPQDLNDLITPFAEVSKAQMHRLSLGNFFTPVDNWALAGAQHTKLQSELQGELARTGRIRAGDIAGEDGVHGDVNGILDPLFDKLHSRRMLAHNVREAAKERGAFAHLAANYESATVPQSMRDLSFKEIKAALAGTGYDDDAAVNAVQRSIRKSYDLGYKWQGLAALEDHLRSTGLPEALNWLGKTPSGKFLTADTFKGAAKGAAIGAAFGVGSQALQGDTNPDDLIKAGLGGAAAGVTADVFREGFNRTARRGVGWGMSKANVLSKVENAGWSHYTYLPDGLAKARNYLRFTISPFFDLRRYTKGAMIAQMEAAHAGVDLPLIGSMKALERDFGAGAATKARVLWDNTSGGNYSIMEDTERHFSQHGILGYSPREQMAAINYRLVQQGMDPEQAATLTKKIGAYGSGRSAAEKSVNFAFFPFSFEKKVLTAGGKFLSDDLARTVMLHDALKTYHHLNEKYDLNKELEDHLPILHQISKLNAFAHGISPGELGGINSPLLQAFIPVGLNIGHDLTGGVIPSVSHDDARHLGTRLFPVYNDIARLTTDLQEQGHVAFSPSHLTSQAESDAAYADWGAFKGELDRQLTAAGYKGFESIFHNKDLEDVHQQVNLYKAHLASRYPAWQKALDLAVQHKTQNERQLNATYALALNGEGAPAERATAEFYGVLQDIEGQLSGQGLSVTEHPEDLPPEVFGSIRDYAFQLAQTEPGFVREYNRYWRRLFGPIQREMV